MNKDLPKIILTGVVALSSTVSAQIATQLPSPLQSLQWGASEEQVIRSLPPNYSRSDCHGIEKQIAAALGEACDSPKVPYYMLREIPFTLHASLSAATRQLKQVSLHYAGAILPATSLRNVEDIWARKVGTIYSELQLKYGKAHAAEKANSDGTRVRMFSWSLGRTLIGYTAVLSDSGSTSPKEEHSISYTPLDETSKSRL